MTRIPAALAGATSLLLLAAAVSLPAGGVIRLVDVTGRAGIRFTHYTGAFGQKYLPETLGSGVAVFDVDGDGAQDVLLVNGTDWPGRPASGPARTAKLFRNDGRGRFTDISAGSGLDVPIYGMGVAAADFDNDGRVDVLITAVGQNRLFRNLGGGRFGDVTDRAGLGGRSAFSTSALWFDYDRDGLLDLVVCNYVGWTPETDVFCSTDGRTKTYCTPEAYPGTTLWLFRNAGGTFRDVTASAGLFDPTSKALGVTMIDYDADGWPDLFVANDTQPNKLYRNKGNGTFVETAVQAGLAFSEDGRARAGMGTDAADYDNSGVPSFVVTNFSGEMLGLYKPGQRGQFEDRAPGSEVGRVTRLTLGFGCFFFDVDLDGLLDLLVVNGHIDDTIAGGKGRITYAEPPHLFLNLGGGKLADVAAEAGPDFAAPKVGRGAAYADLDLDGDLDVVLTTNGGPAQLFRNDLGAPSRSVRLTLRGTRSNRDALGTRVRARLGAAWLTRVVRTGSSYLSQSELPLTFGLGDRAALDEATIEWPSGTRETVRALAAGRAYTITESKGITDQRRIVRP